MNIKYDTISAFIVDAFRKSLINTLVRNVVVGGVL